MGAAYRPAYLVNLRALPWVGLVLGRVPSVKYVIKAWMIETVNVCAQFFWMVAMLL